MFVGLFVCTQCTAAFLNLIGLKFSQDILEIQTDVTVVFENYSTKVGQDHVEAAEGPSAQFR